MESLYACNRLNIIAPFSHPAVNDVSLSHTPIFTPSNYMITSDISDYLNMQEFTEFMI